MQRRVVVVGAASTVGVLAAAGGLGASAAAARSIAGGINPLHMPSTVSPGGFTLTAQPGTADLGGGRTTDAWVYNAAFPGPTIVANRGDVAAVTLVNGLSQETTTHWHGMVVPSDADGHPKDAISPGRSYLYQFAVDQRAGLSWYHPHPHMHTGEQVYRGLAGAFVVRDAEEAALIAGGTLPSAPYEIPLIIRDASFDSRGNLSFGAKSSGFLGNTPLVNGTLGPYLSVDQAAYRFRVLNGANARIFRLALSTAAPFSLVGNDGGLLAAAVPVSEIRLAPAERLDVLVDFRSLARDATVTLRCLDAGWNLLQFRGTGVSGGGVIPTALSTITPLAAPVRTRDFSFDGMSRINGQTFSLTRVDFQVPFGDTERWRFRTNGNAPHPVHVHGASFQIQSRTGGRGQLFPWESGWKDTVLLDDGETVEVLIRFDHYRGRYLLHCHQLAHEDNGMMANFDVV